MQNIDRPVLSRRRRRRLLGLCIVAGLVSLVGGCESPGSSRTSSHAAVTIRGHSVTDVVVTTREVFEEHEFALAGAEEDRMIFERPGTKGEQVKYGSFGSPGVVMRVKVDLQEMGGETLFLRCTVFTVRDAGDSVLEDETKLILARSKPYRQILEEIQGRLEDSDS